MFLSPRLSAFAAALLISVSSAAALLAPQTALAAESAPIIILAQATTEAASPTAAPMADPAAGTATASIAPTTEKVENPYGLDALWKGGDIVARGTLVILVLMSMSSWYVIITKLIDQVKLGGQAAEAGKKFWDAKTVEAGTLSLKEGSPFRFIAETGIKSTEHKEGALLEHIDLNTWVTMSIQRAVEKVQSRLQDGLALLATVGSTAPFVGLFGTVWGIYNALTAIGIAGQASIDKVAGPVGEALIMTAIGLGVAVPAVLGYNFLVRRNKTAMENVRTFSSDLHSVLLSGVMSTANKKG
ncbi:MAG: biopolymer transport protein ExbB [Burkholderiaceae bacterium]|jgi:biopolymer transport protein ExbB